tara:strand:+ start:4161 stop:4514 length:354 start_codon:yes stop_codon:yes gene_type:complete
MVKMKVIIVVIFILFSVTNAKQTENERKENPCKSTYIKKAREGGLRSLSIFEIPVYYYDARRCEDVIESNKLFVDIEQAQITADFTQSKQMRSWTSSFAYCAIIALTSLYIELIISK